jgi:hypothetical protein
MTLNEMWFTEGFIDFELQKYRLLAYLQEVRQCFVETKLYPQLADLVFHYNNLLSFQNNKRFLQEQFPKKLDSVNVQKLEVVYERMLADDTVMRELEQITGYALDEMKGTINEGTEIYEFVEKKMSIEPVGIVPLYNNEGYVFLRYKMYPDIRIYYYNVTLFEHHNARYKGIKLEFIDNRVKNLANTFEQIKIDIIRSYRVLPNPAVYKVEFPLSVPLNETLLPVAKRALIKYICQSNG